MICPQCSAQVPVTEAQYLSMYTCPKCMAVYFVDMNGQPDFGDMSAQISESQEVQDITEKTPAIETPVVAVTEIPDLASSELMFANQQPSADSFESFTTDIQSPSLTSEPQVLQQELNPFSIQSAETPANLNSVVNEIADFANLNETTAGLITYDLSVSGLDSKEIVILFKEALEDSKLGWLPQDIHGFIRGGKCELKKLTAVQAFIIARRVQFLDIEMKWIQNV